ncbi:MAG: aromatic ring-opening dioxygenase LigA [Acidimicrobiia bacterium]
MRKTAFIASIVVGVVLIIGGVATWIVVSNTLADQKITVADDASCLAGDDVNGPFSAYCQAKVINDHTLESTGGKTYAELDRDDPLRQVAMNSAFLQASLFTSVVAFGVAGMAILVGILFILIGLGMRDVSEVVAASDHADTGDGG